MSDYYNVVAGQWSEVVLEKGVVACVGCVHGGIIFRKKGGSGSVTIELGAAYEVDGVYEFMHPYLGSGFSLARIDGQLAHDLPVISKPAKSNYFASVAVVAGGSAFVMDNASYYSQSNKLGLSFDERVKRVLIQNSGSSVGVLRLSGVGGVGGWELVAGESLAIESCGIVEASAVGGDCVVNYLVERNGDV